MIPDSVRPLFWDTNPETFEPATHPRYTIERVLEHGEDVHVAWLTQVFTTEQIQDVIRTDRHLSPRSATFWSLVFSLPGRDVAGLQR